MNYDVLAATTTTTVAGTTTSNGDKIVNNAVGPMTKLIEEYGPYITILSIFLLIFIAVVIFIIRLNNKMIKADFEQKTKLFNQQITQNDKLVDHLLDKDKENDTTTVSISGKPNATMSNEEKEETKKKDLVSTYIDINLVLKDAIKTATTELNAERVAIYVFHNGNQSIHGLPFFKVSCIHEWSRSGSMAMKTRAYRSITHHSMPLYLLSEVVEEIYAKDVYKASNIQTKRNEYGYLQVFLEHSDADSMYATAIKDNDDNVAGFVIAEFRNGIDINDSDVDNKIKKTLDITSDLVRPVVINLNGKYSIIHDNE